MTQRLRDVVLGPEAGATSGGVWGFDGPTASRAARPTRHPLRPELRSAPGCETVTGRLGRRLRLSPFHSDPSTADAQRACRAFKCPWAQPSNTQVDAVLPAGGNGRAKVRVWTPQTSQRSPCLEGVTQA